MGEFDIPRNFARHPFDDATYRLDSGEGSDPVKEVKPRYFRENQIDNQEYNRRTNCTPDSIVAVAGQITLNLPTGVIDAEYAVDVTAYHGAVEYQWTGFANADDVVIIQNAAAAGRCHLTRDTADIANYAAVGFVAGDFEVWAKGSENHNPKVGVVDIATGRAPGSFNANDLPRDNTPGASDVDTDLTTLETAFELEHALPGGGHDANFLENPMIDPDECFIGEQNVNLINNAGFEHWNAGTKDIDPDEWGSTVNALTLIERETAGAGNVHRGAYSIKIDSKQNGDEIYQILAESVSMGDSRLSGYVYIKGTALREFNIYLWGNVSGGAIGTPRVLTGAWDRFFVTTTFAGDTEIRLRIVRADALDNVFYLDTVMINEGRLKNAWVPSVFEAAVLADDRINLNWLLNPNFDSWVDPINADQMADFWEMRIADNRVRADTASSYFGKYSCIFKQNIAPNEGVIQRIGDITQVLAALTGKTITFSAWFKKKDAPGQVDYIIEIDDGVGTSTTAFNTNYYTDWTRISVTHTVDAAATEITVKVYKSAAVVNDEMYMDSACLNIGSRPMESAGSNLPSIWIPLTYAFHGAGSISDATFLTMNSAVDNLFYPAKLSIYTLLGPTHIANGTADFHLWKESFGTASADTGFYVRLDAELAPDADGQGAYAVETIADMEADMCEDFQYLRIKSNYANVTVNPADVCVRLLGYRLGAI